MRVGLTYDLRRDYLEAGYSLEETAEFDRPDTIDALEGALRKLGHETDRIGNAPSLIRRLAAGDRWELVFNIAEGLHGIGREAQVPAILDVYDIPTTFSDPVLMGLSLHKGMTKLALRGLGLPTPDFAVVATMDELDAVDLPYPLFAKPIAEGTSKGIDARSKVADPRELVARVEELLARYRQPALIETFLPGREFTVGILGTGSRARALGVIEVALNAGAEPEVYSYENKERCEELVTYTLAEDALADECAELALKCWRGLGGRDAGRVDLRADAQGRPSIIEINPLAGLHPEHSDLPILCNLKGIPYLELIREIVESAGERVAVGGIARSTTALASSERG
jgi:D-alanine-D-alanine ligase